jgi:hypothetical protein
MSDDAVGAMTVPGFPKRIIVRERSLGFPADCTWHEFAMLGRHLSTIEALSHESLDWWLGDFCNFGDAQFGEKYAQALELTDYTKGTITQIAYVARHVPPENRILPLSFMASVASRNEAEQKQLAERCHEEGLLQSEFRRMVRGEREYRKPIRRDTSKSEKHLRLEDEFDRIYDEHERAWSAGTPKENARAIWNHALKLALGHPGR